MAKTKTHSTMYSKLVRNRWKVFFWLSIIGIGLAIIIQLLFRTTNLQGYVEPAKNFIFASNAQISSTEGRTNVLVLGRGGEGHEAPDLTDTMIFLSVSKDTKKASLLSLPRDIWSEALKAKINSAYYWGKQMGGSKEGMAKAKTSVEEIVGQPIHYVVILDFSSFTRLIDALGGIEVEVETAFVDNKYPIPGKENDLCSGDKTYGCRYETISFEKGKAMMDGARALKFARSRHAEGDEGTDFARSKRQQKVIDGIRNKILSTGVIFNPEKVSELMAIAQSSVESDMTPEEAGVVARLGFEARDNVTQHVLSDDLLSNPPISARYSRQYVLIPKGGSWQKVQEWVKSILP